MQNSCHDYLFSQGVQKMSNPFRNDFLRGRYKIKKKDVRKIGACNDIPDYSIDTLEKFEQLLLKIK
ncbi:hypothetical protein ACWA1C_09100 [Flectobacillus roseus]